MARIPSHWTGRFVRRVLPPAGKSPVPGKYSDSVEGAETFGPGVLPPQGPVQRSPSE
jgi:hypothetical protein